MRKNLLISAVVGLFALAPLANAGPITTGQWYLFSFEGPGTSLGPGSGDFGVSLALDDSPWTITLASDAILTVTDGFAEGDTFEILDFGVPLGFTSIPDGGVGDCDEEFDPWTCVADPSYSSGMYFLAAGDHSLTGAVGASPFGGGEAFLRIDFVDVPEPGVLTLLGLGLVGIGLRRRRR